MEIKKEVQNSALNEQRTGGVHLASLSFFKKDSYYAYVYKKTERLATATYMLTNFLSDHEPLKWRFRHCVSDLLSYGLNLSLSSSVERLLAVENFCARVLESMAIIELAKMSGLLSEMNSSIMHAEFESFLKPIESNEGQIFSTKSQSISSDFFNLPDTYSADHKPMVEEKVYSTNISVSNYIPIKTNPRIDKGQIEIRDNKTNNVSYSRPISHPTKDNKTSRSELVLSLLKKDKLMSVKDFTNVITDCSEKTIQRELLSLVAKGVLKKEGEKRWSKYSLK